MVIQVIPKRWVGHVRLQPLKTRGHVFTHYPQKGHENAELPGGFWMGCLEISNHFLLLMAEIWLTTWDVWNPINNGINYPKTGARFQPSTVCKNFESSNWNNHLQMDVSGPRCLNETGIFAIPETSNRNGHETDTAVCSQQQGDLKPLKKFCDCAGKNVFFETSCFCPGINWLLNFGGEVV